MWDIILESLRALIIALIFYLIWSLGKKRQLDQHKGWNLVLVGWGLVLMGSLFDITDNFESLNQFIIIGDTKIEAFLEKFVGFLLGYVFLFLGFLYWLPAGAEKIDSMKRDFVSTVSHELRTPLTSINASLKLLDQGICGELSDQAREMVRIALRNGERLENIVNDILLLDKLEKGKLEFRMSPQHILELVKEAITTNREYSNKFHVNLELDASSTDGIISTDPVRFNQVMNNLLSNAIKFSPEHETVQVRISGNGKYMRVSVIDHGPGIPDDFKPYLFEKFTQAKQTANTTPGSGLGLSITRSILQEMGGTIGFTSETDKGSVFFFDLPQVSGL